MTEKITVIGYGSLISKKSALETAPNLTNFRTGYVQGYKRIFNKVGIVFFQRGQVSSDQLEVSSCATRADDRYSILVSVFDVSEEEFEKIYAREHRFRWIEVDVNVGSDKIKGRMCTEYNDSDYQLNKCVYPSVYHDLVGRYYEGTIWRNDILPNKRYLKFCLEAISSVSEEALSNYLDSSFLADGETSIREFLSERPDYLTGVDSNHSYRQGAG